MAGSETAHRILDTAELLFAQRGFAQTSLRAITGQAGVNLAAVNYHFGSKEALVEAVFERFLTPFCNALSAKLDELEESEKKYGLEELLRIVTRLAFGAHPDDPQRVTLFFRLSGQAYSQPQHHLRRYMSRNFGPVFKRVLTHLGRAVPAVSPSELFWRAQFALGAVIFTFSGMESLKEISRNDFRTVVTQEDITQRLVPFLIGGIQAQVAAK